MKTLRPQRDIAEEIAKLVIRLKPNLMVNADFFGKLFAVKAWNTRTGAGIGIKNSKKDTEGLSDFISAINRLQVSHEKLSPRAKQQVVACNYIPEAKGQLTAYQREHFFEMAELYKELALSAKEAYRTDWVVDRSDPAPYSVCRAVYWLAPKLDITVTAGKAPIGVPFGNLGQDCFDIAINEKTNCEHYSREIAKKA